MTETIILMRTNLYEVSEKTGVPYKKLQAMYDDANAQNKLVVLKLDERNRWVVDE